MASSSSSAQNSISRPAPSHCIIPGCGARLDSAYTAVCRNCTTRRRTGSVDSPNQRVPNQPRMPPSNIWRQGPLQTGMRNDTGQRRNDDSLDMKYLDPLYVPTSVRPYIERERRASSNPYPYPPSRHHRTNSGHASAQIIPPQTPQMQIPQTPRLRVQIPPVPQVMQSPVTTSNTIPVPAQMISPQPSQMHAHIPQTPRLHVQIPLAPQSQVIQSPVATMQHSPRHAESAYPTPNTPAHVYASRSYSDGQLQSPRNGAPNRQRLHHDYLTPQYQHSNNSQYQPHQHTRLALPRPRPPPPGAISPFIHPPESESVLPFPPPPPIRLCANHRCGAILTHRMIREGVDQLCARCSRNANLAQQRRAANELERVKRRGEKGKERERERADDERVRCEVLMKRGAPGSSGLGKGKAKLGRVQGSSSGTSAPSGSLRDPAQVQPQGEVIDLTMEDDMVSQDVPSLPSGSGEQGENEVEMGEANHPEAPTPLVHDTAHKDEGGLPVGQQDSRPVLRGGNNNKEARHIIQRQRQVPRALEQGQQQGHQQRLPQGTGEGHRVGGQREEERALVYLRQRLYRVLQGLHQGSNGGRGGQPQRQQQAQSLPQQQERVNTHQQQRVQEVRLHQERHRSYSLPAGHAQSPTVVPPVSQSGSAGFGNAAPNAVEGSCSEPVDNETRSPAVQGDFESIWHRQMKVESHESGVTEVQQQAQNMVEQHDTNQHPQVQDVQRQQGNDNAQTETVVKEEQIAPLLSFADSGTCSEEEVEMELAYPDVEVTEGPPRDELLEVKTEPMEDLIPTQMPREVGSIGSDLSVPVPVQSRKRPPSSRTSSISRVRSQKPKRRAVPRQIRPPSTMGLYTSAPLPPSELRKVMVIGKPTSSGVDALPTSSDVPSTSAAKICSSPDCSTAIPPESTSSRCMACVRKAWTSRKSRAQVTSVGTTSTPRSTVVPRGVLVEVGRPRAGRKSVTWADLPTVSDTEASSEDELESEDSADSGEDEEPREKLKLFIPKEAVLAVKAKRDAAAKQSGVSETVDPFLINEVKPCISTLSTSEITSCEDARNQVGPPEAAERPRDNTAVMRVSEGCNVFVSVDEAAPVDKVNVPAAEADDAKGNTDRVGDVSPAAPSAAMNDDSANVEPVERTTESSLKKTITDNKDVPMVVGQSSSAEQVIISGWDSDLTSLSDSDDDSESKEVSSSLGEGRSSLERPRQRTGLKIKIPARSSINTNVCTITNCSQVLPPGYPWKTCVVCRARTREYQRKRQNLQGRHARLDNELELLQAGFSIQDLYPSSDESPPDRLDAEADLAVVPGARLCSLKPCSHIIPPLSEYKWKMCSVCRKKTKERRRRKELKSRIENGLPVDAMNVSDSDEECPVIPKPLPGRCVEQDCGMLLDDTASSQEQCRQCIARRLGLPGIYGKQRGHSRGARTSNICATAIASALIARSPSEKELIPLRNTKPPPSPPYPPYKCLAALLSDFSVRLKGFLEAQLLYFYYIRQKANRPMGTIFGFDGEFSTVALDYDVVGRREEVEKGVLSIKKEIEGFGNISFDPNRRSSIINVGIITRFMCVHQSSIRLPTPANPEQSRSSTFTMTMKGELEIAVLEDRTHAILPGQRTVIRFRLIG